MKIRCLLIAAVLAAADLFSCAQTGGLIQKVIQVPEVSLADISITDISSTQVGLMLDFAINNPNPRGLELNGIDYQIALADKPLLSGVSSEKMKLVANGVGHSKVPVCLKYQDVKSAYDSIKGKDQISYKVSGNMNINSPLGAVPVPYGFQGTFPVVRPPKLSDISLKVEQLGLSGAKLNINLKMFNPNNFNLDIVGADYALELAGNSFSDGKIESASVPAQSNGTLSVPISIKFSSLAGPVFSLLSGGKADYKLEYNANYKIKNRTVKQAESKSGTLKILQ